MRNPNKYPERRAAAGDLSEGSFPTVNHLPKDGRTQNVGTIHPVVSDIVFERKEEKEKKMICNSEVDGV